MTEPTRAPDIEMWKCNFCDYRVTVPNIRNYIQEDGTFRPGEFRLLIRGLADQFMCDWNEHIESHVDEMAR